jgi:hypothetical protein
MDPAIIIKRLGGTGAVARLFNIKPSSVSEWMQLTESGEPRGIPKARLHFIKIVRPDVLAPVDDAGTADSTEAGS